MNAPVSLPVQRDDIRRFTTVEVFRMIEAGVIDEDENIELIEGELYNLSPKHNRHERAKSVLVRWFNRRLGDEYGVWIESTRYLSDDTFVEPDISITRAKLPSDKAKGADLLLAIEVADTSLRKDLVLKARVYARHGVADYWVVDAERNRIIVHRQPGESGYAEVRTLDTDEEIVPLFDPRLKLRLSDIV